MPNTTITADQLRAVLFATENSNNEEVLRKFSWAGNANSSYSFGVIQFDVRTDHGGVQQFLQDHGFTSHEITDLSKRGGGLSSEELAPLNDKLAAIPRADLDEFTNRNLGEAIGRVDTLIGSLQKTNPSVAAAIAASDELQLAVADYDNQFTIQGIGDKTPPNSMLAYLEGQSVKMPGGTLQLGDTISRSDLQEFVNATGYAQNHERAVAGREARLVGALGQLNLGDPELANTSHIRQAHSASHSSLKLGARGDAVGDLQTRLGELGYTDSRGNPLLADKHFGTTTKAAVEAFQRDQGLSDDGVAGPATQKALKGQTQSLANTNTYEWQCPTRLDNPAHPDNAFYLRTRDLVHQLDQQHGRTPDQRSDQLASALTVQARADGLQRIDRIALNEDASALWGARDSSGFQPQIFNNHCKVDTLQGLNTPMEQSGAQWPQAMQQFQQHHEQTQQVQQQDQAIQQAPQGPQMTL